MSDPEKRRVRVRIGRARMLRDPDVRIGQARLIGDASSSGGTAGRQGATLERAPEMTGAESGRAAATSGRALGANYDATRGGLASVTARRRRR